MKKSILITGANGKIGSAIALQAARQGYNIGLHFHKNYNDLDAIVKQINNLDISVRVKTFQADISIENDVINMLKDFNNYFGSIYALINNASTIFSSSKLENMSFDRLNKIFSVNVLGTMLCCKHSIKYMSKKHGKSGGKIINISSAAARLGSANEYIDYASTKGAMDTLTTGLSLELADDGILVNSIRPGFIHSDIHKLSGDPDRIEKLKDKIPLKRGGLPEEVASSVIWLLSNGANYCTGTFIDMAGGK